MNKQITLLLVDDHTLMLRMLRDRLETEADMHVVAAVDNSTRAISEAKRLQPDVIIMDINMPGVVCFDAIRSIRLMSPNTRTIFLSAFYHDSYIDQALSVEAAGYLTKTEPPEVVIDAIRNVVLGHRCFSPDVQARIVVEEDRVRLAKRERSRVATLSVREREIINYIAQGFSQKDIAELTHRSSKTIHTHCNNIMTKLDIHDRVELTRFAIREGLIKE